MEERKYLGWFQKVADFVNTSVASRLLVIVGSFLGGFLCSRGLVFGRYAPFGVAAVAVMPKGGLIAGSIGAAIGYLVPSATYVPVRYIAALIAVAAIRWSLSELKRVNTHPFFAPIITFLPLLATGMTMVLINKSQANTAAMYIAETFLASGSTYFLSRAVTLTTSRRSKINFDPTDIAALTIAVGILVLAFAEVTISGVSIGRILMVIFIMYCANCGGISGGAIAGITAGVIQGLSTAGLTYLSGAYGLGGLMAGVFAGVGKIFAAVAFIIAHGVSSLQIGDTTSVVTASIEVAVATVIYMVIPKSQRLSDIFCQRRDRLTGDSLRNNIISRLNFAGDALLHVSDSVQEIARKLTVTPTINTVMNSSVSEVCAGCSMRMVCWKKEKDATVKSFGAMGALIKKKGAMEKDDFGEALKEKCKRLTPMADAINRNYHDFIATEALELKSAQMRTITSEQFATASGLLKDIAKEFTEYQHFDEETSDRVEEIFKKNNIFPIEVCCRVDSFGRMTVEAELERNREQKLNKAYFTREVSNACGRTFAQPCISMTDESCRIMMCQKPLLDVGFGYYQHSASNSTFCGDSVTGFYDGQGHYIALISDGMGTGGRAAVDGVMASSMAETLIKAGVGYDSALRLINSALMAKSGDESLATLDIATVDLFTGKAEFRKAGGAGTFIRRGRRVDYVEEPSLPVGIMDNVSFAYFDENLKENDIIVMVSDGVTSCGTDWIKEIVGDFEDDDPEFLAKKIVTETKKQRNDGHEDDITALVIKMK